jgi:hypothetical protein
MRLYMREFLHLLGKRKKKRGVGKGEGRLLGWR